MEKNDVRRGIFTPPEYLWLTKDAAFFKGKEIGWQAVNQLRHDDGELIWIVRPMPLFDPTTKKRVPMTGVPESYITWTSESMKMRDECKPCPFCEYDQFLIRSVLINDLSYDCTVTCPVCGARGPQAANKGEAKAYWNRRTSADWEDT